MAFDQLRIQLPAEFASEQEQAVLAHLDTHAAEVDVLALAQLARHHLIEPGALDRLSATSARRATPRHTSWIAWSLTIHPSSSLRLVVCHRLSATLATSDHCGLQHVKMALTDH